jgi:hypothetical protein
MKVRSIIRWYIYLSIITVSAVYLGYGIVDKQKNVGIDDFLYKGVAIYYNDSKPKELLGYLVGAAILFFIFFTYVIARSSKRFRGKKRYMSIAASSLRLTKENIVTYFHIFLLLLAFVGFAHDHWLAIILESYVLLYFFFNMYGYAFASLLSRLNRYGLYGSFISALILLAMVGQVTYLFSDHIWGRPKVINEYFSIPEVTRLGNRYVDNTAYINRHHIIGCFNKWDIRYEDYRKNYVDMVMPYGDIRIPALSNQYLYYDEARSRLYLNGYIDDDLIEMYGSKELEDLNKLNRNHQRYCEYTKWRYSKEDRRFVKNNAFEIHWQILGRYMFHHHSFITNPVLELELGKPQEKIKAQYGMGNLYVFKYLMDRMGGVSMHNWLKLSAFFYVLYFAIYALVVFILFENKLIAAFVYAMSLVTLNLVGYGFIILAPGNSPWRHFLDIVIVLVLMIYQRKGNLSLAALALIMGGISVYMNPEIGLMISVAVMTSLMIYSYVRSGIRAGLVAMVLMAFVLDAFLLVNFSSHNELSGYYLQGVLGFKVSETAMVIIFGVLIAGYVVLMYDVKRVVYDRFLVMIYLFVYLQGLVFYYVWHADNNGLLSRSHIYVLVLSLYIYDVWGERRPSWGWKNSVVAGMIGVGMVLYFDSSSGMLKQKKKYEDIFATHKTYNWDFYRAKIESTIDPVYFDGAVKLMNKYSGNTPSICMISKYDNVLLLLASKYTIMPMQDMKWYSVTEKELYYTIDLIKKAQPEYLYVDTDINRNYNDDVIKSDALKFGYLSQESIWRAERMKIMARMFSRVSKDYKLVETGDLISVYKKNP